MFTASEQIVVNKKIDCHPIAIVLGPGLYEDILNSKYSVVDTQFQVYFLALPVKLDYMQPFDYVEVEVKP